MRDEYQLLLKFWSYLSFPLGFMVCYLLVSRTPHEQQQNTFRKYPPIQTDTVANSRQPKPQEKHGISTQSESSLSIEQILNLAENAANVGDVEIATTSFSGLVRDCKNFDESQQFLIFGAYYTALRRNNDATTVQNFFGHLLTHQRDMLNAKWGIENVSHLRSFAQTLARMNRESSSVESLLTSYEVASPEKNRTNPVFWTVAELCNNISSSYMYQTDRIRNMEQRADVEDAIAWQQMQYGRDTALTNFLKNTWHVRNLSDYVDNLLDKQWFLFNPDKISQTILNAPESEQRNAVIEKMIAILGDADTEAAAAWKDYLVKQREVQTPTHPTSP